MVAAVAFVRDLPEHVARRPRAAAAASGALQAAGFPPRGWWYLAVAGLALWILAVSSQDGWRARARVGFAGGLAWGLVNVALIWRPVVPIVVVIGEVFGASIFALFFVAVAVLTPPGRWALLGGPVAWAVLDSVLARWPFGGLPLVGVTLSVSRGPIAEMASIGGQVGVVLTAVTAGSALAALWLAPRRWMASLAVAGVVTAVVAAAGSPRGRAVAEVPTVLVQGGGDRGVSATPYAVTYRLHREALREVAPGPGLVVLPEGTAHTRDDVEPFEVEEMARAARRIGSTLVVGIVERVVTEDRFLNSAFVWSPSGDVIGRYDKVHGVPFAEYVPGRGVLEKVLDLSLIPRDLKEGDVLEPIDSPAGRLGILVSFEVFFPGLTRDLVRDGAEVILVPTNAGSFTDAGVPAFEVEASRLRAIESGRWVLQVTPTGFSAIVDPHGRVVAKTGLGADAQFAEAVIEMRRGRTVFARVGEWPFIAFSAAGLAGVWLARDPAALRKLRRQRLLATR